MSNVAKMLPDGRLRMRCPGCGNSHAVPVNTPDGWTWNGDLVKPTLSPSLLVHSHKTFDRDDNVVDTPRCHSFVRDGQWQFLSDCMHGLAGQTVPVPPLDVPA